MAMILLLLAVATCASQGLSMALCRCSGDVFMGAAPASCCGECPGNTSADATEHALTPDPDRCLLSTEECFIVVTKGWETYLPTDSRETAPAPAVATAEPLAALLPHTPRDLPAGMSSWNLIHQPTPPGLSRVLLYRSLLI